MELALENVQLALSLKAMENTKSKLMTASIAVLVQVLAQQALFLRLTNLKNYKSKVLWFFPKHFLFLSAAVSASKQTNRRLFIFVGV